MKKIISIVAVIAAITACFCIGANAYERGETLEKGTIITFSDTLNGTEMRDINTIYFESNGNNYNALRYLNETLIYIDTTYNNVYKNSTGWIDNKYKTIKLVQDYTLDASSAIMFNSSNVNITTPTITKTLNNTKATFSTTLTVATAIIAWLVANQIALVGLYMYILITLVLIGKRYIKGV